MKIAYFGGDWFLSCTREWLQAGHQISHVFTHGEQSYNQQLRSWAERHQVKIIIHKPEHSDMQMLQNDGVDCLFCNEYPWLIPCAGFAFKTINVHPSLLPEGKGPTPLSWILLKYPQFAGVTLHKLASEYDCGDIISQQPISLHNEETMDTLLARLEIMIPAMLGNLLEDFESQYANARPQSGGSYWPKISLNDRKINWHTNVDTIQRQIRASGQFGVVLAIESHLYLVTHMQCTQEEHQFAPGTLFKENSRHLYISCLDGICVIDRHCILEKAPLANQT